MSQWDQLHKRAKSLEARLEVQASTYAAWFFLFSNAFSPNPLNRYFVFYRKKYRSTPRLHRKSMLTFYVMKVSCSTRSFNTELCLTSSIQHIENPLVESNDEQNLASEIERDLVEVI